MAAKHPQMQSSSFDSSSDDLSTLFFDWSSADLFTLLFDSSSDDLSRALVHLYMVMITPTITPIISPIIQPGSSKEQVPKVKDKAFI